MKHTALYGSVAIAALVVAFILTPTAKVDHGIGKFELYRNGQYQAGEYREQKSGFRIAIEGRLAWLGLVQGI